jgi:hypothetical protein
MTMSKSSQRKEAGTCFDRETTDPEYLATIGAKNLYASRHGVRSLTPERPRTLSGSLAGKTRL